MPNQSIKRLDPKHLATKHAAEVSRHRLSYFVQVDIPSQFFLHRGHRPSRNSAGHDQVEVAEIRIHIQSETMRSNRARNVHADGGDLCLGACVVAGLGPALIGSKTPSPPVRFCPHSPTTRDS